MASIIETPRWKTQDAVTLTDVTVTATAYNTSVWLPCDGVAEFRVWATQVNAGTSDLDIFIDFSPLHYQVLRDLGTDVSTQHYERITVVSAMTAEILTSYSISDVGDLEYPPASFRVHVDNDSATDTIVTVIVEGKG
jgi:hypothetical protein